MNNTTNKTNINKTVKTAFGVSAAILVAVAVGSAAYAEGSNKRGGKHQGKGRGGISSIFLHNADINGDKAITFEEISVSINTFFADVDSDSDSILSKTELETGLKAKAEERRATRADSKEGELRKGRKISDKRSGKHSGKRGEKHLDRLIERIDINGDGSLAKSEVQERMEKTFAFLDVNADGKLEGKELRKGKPFKGKHRGKGPSKQN